MADKNKLHGQGARVHPDCEIDEVSQFGPYTEVGQGSRIANSRFGAYAYCDRYCDIANAEIGKFANIASFTRIGATDHPLDRASLHHFLYRSDDYWEDAAPDQAWFAARAGRQTRIGHDTWLGHGCQIKPDVTIGHGAVVASGAVVTRDVAPYTIVAGMPAVKLRDRLEPDLAERLIALAWWDWDHPRLRQALEDFRALPVRAFLDRYQG